MEDTTNGTDAARAATWAQVPVRDRALRHSVVGHVMAAVQAGHLTPGERIHETSLARALDVSLSPVREALFRLADQGILEHRPRRGFYVKMFDEKETRDVYTFRVLLEGFAARQLAERWAGGELDESVFERLVADLDDGGRAALAGDRRGVAAHNARFHDRLVHSADNWLLDRSWGLLAPAEWLLVTTWTWHDEPLLEPEARDWIDRHRRLLDALRAGDGEAAEREAAAHVREAGVENVRRRFRSEDGA